MRVYDGESLAKIMTKAKIPYREYRDYVWRAFSDERSSTRIRL